MKRTKKCKCPLKQFKNAVYEDIQRTRDKLEKDYQQLQYDIDAYNIEISTCKKRNERNRYVMMRDSAHRKRSEYDDRICLLDQILTLINHQYDLIMHPDKEKNHGN